MKDRTAYLRCRSCKTVNRLPAERLIDRPRCGKCRSALEFPRTPVEVTAATFDEEVLQWPGSVLVEFWSPRCSVCDAIAPFLEHLARREAGVLKVAKINIERELLLANRFDILSTPVFVVYRNGVRINELYGALPKAQMEAWIESSVSG